jgi:hypothetical protein
MELMYKKNQRAISKTGWTAYVLIAFMGFVTVSCEKSEGQGGTGSISGTITELFYNDDYSELIFTAPAVDEEVFILFGNDKTPGDDVNTGASGDFRFDYLYPGTYHVYYRSEDSATLGDEQWPMIDIDIENGEKVNLGVLEKKTKLFYDDGAAVIGGVVRKIKYDNDSRWPNLVVEYIDFAHEQEVYITYGNHTFYDERVRTQADGYFEFKNLIPGKYRVFLYSEDVTKVTEHVVLEFETTITGFDQVIDLGVITVEAI